MRNTFLHELKYINWRDEAQVISVDHKKMNEILHDIRSNRVETSFKTKRSEFINSNTYFIEKKRKYLTIYLKENDDYKVYTTNTYDNTKNGDVIKATGSRAIHLLHEKFRELNGIEFKTAFGYVDEEFKRCIPKQFYYINRDAVNAALTNISAIDGCSQYPSNLMGLLPDAHDALTIKGRAQPNYEYPFAFYIKSGHCAQYGVFDTHNWISSKFSINLFRLERFKEDWPLLLIPDEEEVTILMKASKYNFNREMQYFYARRKEDPDAKLVMNSSIGMMHKDEDYTRYRMAHIVAIAIARANNSLLQMADKIGFIRIIHICVDGIIYVGSAEYGVKEKKLGVYHQEFTNCRFRMIGINAYIVLDKDGHVVKVKHGGYDSNKDGSPIDESKITSLKDSDNWCRVVKVEA